MEHKQVGLEALVRTSLEALVQTSLEEQLLLFGDNLKLISAADGGWKEPENKHT